jgi:hypothetical protein
MLIFNRYVYIFAETDIELCWEILFKTGHTDEREGGER